ncbi:hypothetical protein lacNasYZ03_14480 [Lactobacillus nasalidis]|uniref:Uncharacterized protein n=1 Tax=Lactobacillus nasalidis TaxID=2797258 RepID=A0ABQ3W8A2_9LACO|nr:hypothetical protein [Lactobacillus nasalidis]GHV97611.1 hypothetical protein lacNasYZ01_07930 [Lactobacillus nasalidis]GHV98824.1 hypothetical protein lacNasYZ02_02540 [Lactobacillus nasalidis]GHW01761.1 hypothetical protein lacNasYZ03_14480 [Lactobacillus nasalidis]
MPAKIIIGKWEENDRTGVTYIRRYAEADENDTAVMQAVPSTDKHTYTKKIMDVDKLDSFSIFRVINNSYNDTKVYDIGTPVMIIDRQLENIKYRLINRLPITDKRFETKGVNWLIGQSFENGKFTGLLIKSRQVEEKNGEICLKPSVKVVEKYIIDTKDIVTCFDFYNQYKFYGRKDLPKRIVRERVSEWHDLFNKLLSENLGKFLEEVKDLSSFKRAENTIKKFLEKANDETIVKQIADYIDEDQYTVAAEFKEYLKDSGNHLSFNDEDADILSDLVQNNNDLRERTYQKFYERWQNQNIKELKAGQAEISKTQKQLQQEQEKYKNEKAELEPGIQEMRHKVQELQKKIKNQTELYNSITDKLKQAEGDVAEFRAKNLLYGNTNDRTKDLVPETKQTQSVIASVTYQPGTRADYPETEIDDLDDVLFAIGDNISFVSDNNQVSQLLYTSLWTDKPLLLVGPMAEELIRVLSLVSYNREPGVLDCTENVAEGILQQIESSDDEIIIIRNLFGSKNVAKIASFVSRTTKKIFVVHPFKEDLVLEPKSLYYYFTPIVTDIFVNKVCKSNFNNLEHLNKLLKVSPREGAYVKNYNQQVQFNPLMEDNWLQYDLEDPEDPEINKNSREILKWLQLSWAYLTDDAPLLEVFKKNGKYQKLDFLESD